MFTREGIARILSQGAATVKFTKVDGTERVMHCTIASHLVPEEKMPYYPTPNMSDNKVEYPKIVNMAVLKVFDLDAAQWRSFRIESVKEVTVGYEDQNQVG